MNTNQTFNQRLSARRSAGWTLIEMMIAVGISTFVMAGLLSSYMFISRTMDATANYEELDRQSRNAIDLITSDIRQCGGLTSFSTNSLSFTNLDGSSLQFSWDGTNYVSYTNASTNLAGCPRSGILLKGCSYLNFSIFQRNPVAGTTMTFTAATNAALAKVVVMDWTCRRTNYLSLKDTESVQTAKVVMRN
jgi:Tfp pilus assembly protein PilW